MQKKSPHSFFKYYSPDTTKAVLKSGRLKWSSPKLFNDPFDSQIDMILDVTEKDLADEIFRSFQADLASATTIQKYTPRMNAIINFLHQVYLQSGIEHTEEELDYLREGALEGARNAIASFPKVNNEIKELNRDMSIFCASEVQDSIEMWSYYAQDHSGMVLEFLPFIGNSPFSVAQPVKYLSKIPRLSSAELVNSAKLAKLTIDRITLTKSLGWRHEKEWRIVSSMRDKSKSFELLPFNRNELGSIILGVKSSSSDRAEVIELARKNFPFAKIYKAHLSKTDFAMHFEEIPIKHPYTIDPFVHNQLRKYTQPA
jgi:hypothetical protein